MLECVLCSSDLLRKNGRDSKSVAQHVNYLKDKVHSYEQDPGKKLMPVLDSTRALESFLLSCKYVADSFSSTFARALQTLLVSLCFEVVETL